MSETVHSRPRATAATAPDSLLQAVLDAAQAVLFAEQVQPADDFFDLGGSSLTAIAFALHVEQATGLRLSTTMLYETPRLADLASALRAQVPPAGAVRVRRGQVGLAPVFLLPGIASSAAQMLRLGRALDLPNPVLALEPPGLAPGSEPAATMEQTAALHAAAIESVAAGGPVHLVGMCFGGLVAIEIARRLGEQRTASLTLINSFPHARFWPWPARLGTWLQLLARVSPRALGQRLVRHHLPAIRAGGSAQALRTASRAATLPFRIFGLSAYAGRPVGPDRIEALPPSLARVLAAERLAFQAYAPAPFRGRVLLVTPGFADRLPFRAARYWPRLIADLARHTVPGDQSELLSARLAETAAAITRFIAATAPRG